MIIIEILDESLFASDITINNGSKDCVIIFHGFGATPFEMFHVAEAVANLPVDVLVPLLPKHGINSKVLAELKLDEVISWGINYVQNVRKRYNRVFVLGHSMGSGLTYNIATAIPDIDGVIISALGRDFSLKLRLLTWLARRFNIRYMPGIFSHLKQSKIIAPEYINWKKRHFPKQPVLLMRDVVENTPAEFSKLPNIKTPFMLIMGTNDFLSSANYIDDFLYQTVSKRKIVVLLKNGNHRIFLSRFKFRVIPKIVSFLQELLSSKADEINGSEYFILNRRLEINKTDYIQNIYRKREARQIS
ncbi:MAG: alpha/beta hydrolase [Candidatus Heimdallarchaeota archaeon]|nr:alpha/beta hydrolase [Candidatus Heimdallarchaeota archaeon]